MQVPSSSLADILFIDIETVPAMRSFKELPDEWQELWKHKASFLDVDPEDEEFGYGRAGIYSEFGKIVCISMGTFRNSVEDRKFRVKSFASDNEAELLGQFADLLNTYYQNPGKHLLCGHNIREFDVPYLCRRMLVHDIKLPEILDLSGRKPWEVPHIDTMQMWKFGDYKSYTSLNLLCAVFNIPTPKEDISGKDVGRVYWEESDLERISQYCENDVVATARVYLRLTGDTALKDSEIKHIK